MKRTGRVMLILGLLISGSYGLYGQGAAPVAPATTSAIAILNFNAAVLGTAEAQKNLDTLQKKYAPREQQLQRLNDEVDASKKTLSDGGARLTETERNKQLQALDTKEKQLQREAEDFRNDSQTESQQVFQQVAQKVFSYLQEFSLQHGYAAVLERGSDASPVVWYAASHVDITDQIIKGYDAGPGAGSSSLPDKPLPSKTSSGTPPKNP